MRKIERFVIWICSKFTRNEIEQIIQGLQDVLANRNPEVKPKDDFKEKHPNWRNFYVDPNLPLPAKEESKPKLEWKELLKQYEKEHGESLKPVNCRKEQNNVPDTSTCRVCGASSKYLYFNDGKRRQQIRCKVCSSLTQVHPRDRETRKSKYACPYCTHKLFLWKENKDVSIYKCCNDNCSHYLTNKSKLNLMERILIKVKSSQFKLCYQFREYHFTNEQLMFPSPERKNIPSFLLNIHNSLNTLCLALTFRISCGLSSRKTSFVLRNVFSIPISHQTVENYCEYASYYCHHFNLAHKEENVKTHTGDEAFIKIMGKNFPVFFFLSGNRRSVTSYVVASDKGVLPATISMKETLRTSSPLDETTCVTDGNPSYVSAYQFLKKDYPLLIHKKVIGLQNLDSESEEFRRFKEIIERFIRTYGSYTRRNDFKSPKGALSFVSLFSTHYNFLRPHQSLNYEVPIPLKELEDIPTIQGGYPLKVGGQRFFRYLPILFLPKIFLTLS